MSRYSARIRELKQTLLAETVVTSIVAEGFETWKYILSVLRFLVSKCDGQGK